MCVLICNFVFVFIVVLVVTVCGGAKFVSEFVDFKVMFDDYLIRL